MKRILIIFIVFFSCSLLKGQNTPIYNWQDHLSYKNAKIILEVEDDIYCSTENGLYYYNKNDYTINRLNKINGLSDIKISAMAYDKENKIVVLAYENCNIDLIKDGNVINIPDIKIKEIFGEKKIYNLYIHNEISYICTSFGLILLDLKKKEIKDTYKLMSLGNDCKIYNATILNDYFFISTTCGKFYANIYSSTLNDFNSWELDSSSTHLTDFFYSENADTMIYIYNHLSSPLSNSISLLYDTTENNLFNQNQKENTYSNNSLHRIYDNKIIFCRGLNLYDSDTLNDEKFENLNYSISDKENNFWIADSLNSLMKFKNLNFHSTIKPNGPASNSIKKINYDNGFLFVLHNSQQKSISKSIDLIDWEIIDVIKNVACSKSRLEETYYGSSTDGIFKIDDFGDITHFNLQNTNNILDTNDNIVGLTMDLSGNLWGTKSNSSHPLFCKSFNGDWYSFNMPFVASSSTQIGEIIIDYLGQKWGIIEGNGMFVYNDNNTIDNISDDQFIKIGTGEGNGNLPDKEVYAIENDLNGNIWVGTKTGVCVFYSPSAIFNGYNFDAQQIIVEENGFGQYLLESEIVYSIAIDGGNRKWIGTLSSGIYLLSEDGTEEVYHFTTENSPLISNTILDIEINGETGEIFILTNKGLMSFRNDATSGKEFSSTLSIFPNPVREGYNGYISINGLVSESEVKITDISGNLIFETRSNGGTAVWDGSDINHNRVGTGVYIVFSSDQYGDEKAVGKILFIY